ncbi:MAG: hypothetical protein ACK54T_02650 [bacterium]
MQMQPSTRSPEPGSGPASGARMNLRRTQMAALALIAGTLVFAGVATIVSLSRSSPSVPPMLWGFNAFVVGAGGLLILSTAPLVLMGGVFAKRAGEVWKARQDDEQAIGVVMQLYQKLALSHLAVLEGVALLACVGMMLTGDWLCLGVGGVVLVGMGVVFPTSSRLQSFLDEATGRDGEG